MLDQGGTNKGKGLKRLGLTLGTGQSSIANNEEASKDPGVRFKMIFFENTKKNRRKTLAAGPTGRDHLNNCRRGTKTKKKKRTGQGGAGSHPEPEESSRDHQKTIVLKKRDYKKQKTKNSQNGPLGNMWRNRWGENLRRVGRHLNKESARRNKRLLKANRVLKTLLFPDKNPRIRVRSRGT